jgi:hypothetical protein
MTRAEIRCKASELEDLVISFTGETDVRNGMIKILNDYMDKRNDIREKRRFILNIFKMYLENNIEGIDETLLYECVINEMFQRAFNNFYRHCKGYINQNYTEIIYLCGNGRFEYN